MGPMERSFCSDQKAAMEAIYRPVYSDSSGVKHRGAPLQGICPISGPWESSGKLFGSMWHNLPWS